MVSIRKSLNGTTIFLTGATGYFGRALLYRLLRDLRPLKIYLLVRGSSKQSARERWESEILSDPMWKRVLPEKTREDLLSKLTLVEGDVSRPDLGIATEKFEQLAGDLDLIINSAACISFEPPLDEALNLNINGPLHLLALAKAANCPFLQVSTAFVCGNQDGVILEETPSKPPAWIHDRIQGLKQIVEDAERAYPDPSQRKARSEHMKGSGNALANKNGWPNAYTYSKFLAEQQLMLHRGGVPLILFRPAIISSAHAFPYPGWIESIRGMDLLLVAFGDGQLSYFPAKKEIPLDLVPVDLAANACIASLAKGMTEDTSVFQFGTSLSNPLIFRRFADLTWQHYSASPKLDATGDPIRMKPLVMPDYEQSQRRIQRLSKFRSLLSLGLKPLAGVMRIGVYRRRLGAKNRLDSRNLTYMKMYSNFTTTRREFSTAAMDAVYKTLPAEEQSTFNFDYRELEWDSYVRDIHVPGLRKCEKGLYE
ncbi:MAG: SDR family oxidoreductase [Verrucomicrobiota bacterium]